MQNQDSLIRGTISRELVKKISKRYQEFKTFMCIACPDRLEIKRTQLMDPKLSFKADVDSY